MATSRAEAPVRERLLAAANELFYQEGVHAVGIDRVLEHAGVAKASLYGTFGSKDELVRAYLERRAITRRERIELRVSQHAEPRARILAVFELLEEIAAEPTFRGCAFVNASAEGPRGDTPVTQVCAEQRRWVRSLFTELARGAGAPDPENTGRRLALLYDGAITGASMDSDPSTVGEARAMAEQLLDGVVGASKKRRDAPALRGREPRKPPRRRP